ncbi:MAG TPA: sensor histidine kinase, partial [Chloroflexia bacterium]|nr:sensor histidine kinase [Chloroflexia bacterium]
PPELRRDIFKRYCRAQKQSQLDGLGLGLYIASQIVELHGGTIKLENPPEGGSRFVLRLPLSAGYQQK